METIHTQIHLSHISSIKENFVSYSAILAHQWWNYIQTLLEDVLLGLYAIFQIWQLKLVRKWFFCFHQKDNWEFQKRHELDKKEQVNTVLSSLSNCELDLLQIYSHGFLASVRLFKEFSFSFFLAGSYEFHQYDFSSQKMTIVPSMHLHIRKRKPHRRRKWKRAQKVS